MIEEPNKEVPVQPAPEQPVQPVMEPQVVAPVPEEKTETDKLLEEYDKKLISKNNASKGLRTVLVITAILFLAQFALFKISEIQSDQKSSCLESIGDKCGSSESSTPFLFCNSNCNPPLYWIVIVLLYISMLGLVVAIGPLCFAAVALSIAILVNSADLSRRKKVLLEKGIEVQ